MPIDGDSHQPNSTRHQTVPMPLFGTKPQLVSRSSDSNSIERLFGMIADDDRPCCVTQQG